MCGVVDFEKPVSGFFSSFGLGLGVDHVWIRLDSSGFVSIRLEKAG
jgi:hypothetical protein